MALIDRALAMEKITSKANGDRMVKLCDVRDALNDTQTVDVMEVVRCRECILWDKGYCYVWKANDNENAETESDDFCSYGERRE